MSLDRLFSKAKQHFFMDACMSECADPVSDEAVRVGAGTKIAITIGPACQDVAVLTQLLLAGMSCARVDLTWGTMDFHRTSLRNLAAAMKATRRLCAVWLDTVGREIVVRRAAVTDTKGWMVLEKTPVNIAAGDQVVVTTDAAAELSASCLPVSVAAFPQLVKPGQLLHVGRFLATGAEDGSLFLQVVSASSNELHCVAQNSASLAGCLTILVCHRQYALSTHDHDLNAELPLLTNHDLECIKAFGAEFELDFVSLSYCNSAEDVWSARQTLDAMGLSQTKILAKVERKAAVHNFDAICAAADAVLFSRGNLGLDFEPEEMALLQKGCVAACNQVGKPILLTRFVDTMVNTPRPTRAEATDVANAVLDGVDGILLGAETVRGHYPLATVQTVVKLCAAAEAYFDYRNHHETMMGEAFDEEVGLERAAYGSTMNLAEQGNGAGSPLAPPRPQSRPLSMMRRAPLGSTGALDKLVGPAGNGNGKEVLGSPGGMDASHAGFAAQGMGAKASSFGVLPFSARSSSVLQLNRAVDVGTPFMSKVESIASTATRTAEKIDAGLIVVLAQTGRTVSLVSKYRPPMPVLAVVVPTLRSNNGLGWQLEGKYLARQTLIMRGVRPMLAAPMTDAGESLLSEAVAAASAMGLVKPNAYVVCIMSEQRSLVVKVLQVNTDGSGIRQRMLQSSALNGEVEGEGGEVPALGAFGTPPSPSYMRQTSFSLVGAGMGAAGGSRNPGPLLGGTMAGTVSELTESMAAAAVAPAGARV